MSLIFLLGMPGCGKSFWSYRIAKETGYKSMDLDEEIELKEGKCIPDIFEEGGEEAFRKIETNVLKDIIASCNNTIIACGGGTPIFNMGLIKSSGCSIYLDEEIEKLVFRIHNDSTSRPLLDMQKDLHAKLFALRLEREVYYCKADYTLSGNNINLNNLKEILKQCTNRQL